MKNLKTLILATILLVSFSSCNNDDTDDQFSFDDEFITTVTTTLTEGNNVITLKSVDIDGNGPKEPVVSVSGDLKVNTTYNGFTTFLNESVTPIYDVTREILEDADDHQLFYQAPTTIGTFAYGDQDEHGKPVGLKFALKTGATTTSGTITVLLKHDLNKYGQGVSSGDVTNAGGRTAPMVVFPVKVVN